MESTQQYSANLIFQYSVVGLILLIILMALIFRLFGKKKKKKDCCCGCSLSETCNRKENLENGKDTDL